MSSAEVRDPADPTPDPELTLDFLACLRPGGPWVLTAIHPDRRGIETRTLRTRGEVEAFCDRHRDRNLYYSLNPTRRAMEKKAERTDIAALEFLHVDVDPRPREDLAEEQRRIRALLTSNLPAGVPEPTVVIFSGGGYQALWQLRDPYPIPALRPIEPLEVLEHHLPLSRGEPLEFLRRGKLEA